MLHLFLISFLKFIMPHVDDAICGPLRAPQSHHGGSSGRLQTSIPSLALLRHICTKGFIAYCHMYIYICIEY